MMANDFATLTDLHQEAEEKTVVLRSCWNCNAAHEYMRTWDDVVICCFECGHYYFKGQDLTPNMTVTQDAERPLTEKDPMGNQPEKKFRAGGVTATVWNNEIETKEYFKKDDKAGQEKSQKNVSRVAEAAAPPRGRPNWRANRYAPAPASHVTRTVNQP